LLARRLGPRIDPEEQVFVDYILGGSRRMGDLVQDLIAYLRLGDPRKDKGPVDCGKAVQEAMAGLALGIHESQAVITMDSLPVIEANLSQIVQLFQNLIGNSVKYGKSGIPPRIHISSVRQGGRALISVRDNGIGFKSEYAEQIFGVFKRLHTTLYPGTGIGLAICKRIVEQHGGTIWAEGGDGQGATFSFTLPFHRDR